MQHVVDVLSRPQVSFQILRLQALLFHPELDCLNRVWWGHRTVLALVVIEQENEDLKAIPRFLGRPGQKQFHFSQATLILLFCPNWPDAFCQSHRSFRLLPRPLDRASYHVTILVTREPISYGFI